MAVNNSGTLLKAEVIDIVKLHNKKKFYLSIL